VVHSTAAERPAEIQDSVDPEPLTLSQEHAPARSAALITVEMSEAFPPAGGQALEVALVVVVFTVAVVDDIGECMHPRSETC
jgi:hypothetical protein